uniref:Uncharacterized protein n=1 Tax=Anguilla anguilla TaxID=7936 RepID=A0A0E9RCX3_ANGAN
MVQFSFRSVPLVKQRKTTIANGSLILSDIILSRWMCWIFY